MLREALEDLVVSDHLPAWAERPLRNGVRDLLFTIENFVIFGHDEALAGIVDLVAKTKSIVSSINSENTNRSWLWSLLTALVFAVDLFAAAPNVAQAYVSYRDWATATLETVRPLLSPPPLQIEGPKATEAI